MIHQDDIARTPLTMETSMGGKLQNVLKLSRHLRNFRHFGGWTVVTLHVAWALFVSSPASHFAAATIVSPAHWLKLPSAKKRATPCKLWLANNAPCFKVSASTIPTSSNYSPANATTTKAPTPAGKKSYHHPAPQRPATQPTPPSTTSAV